MASLLIRHLDDALHGLLKERARKKNHSLAEEVRETLRDALARNANTAEPENLYGIARGIFGKRHGVELELPHRQVSFERAAPDFSGPEYDP